MAGNIKDVRIVTFSEDYGLYKKGEHAMHVSLADKLKAKGAKITVKLAKEEVEKRVETLKAKLEKQTEKKD